MFADFIKTSGQTRAAWAKRLGISPSYLSDLVNGKKLPSLDLAVRIERETGGVVVANSWIAPVADEAQAALRPEEDAA